MEIGLVRGQSSRFSSGPCTHNAKHPSKTINISWDYHTATPGQPIVLNHYIQPSKLSSPLSADIGTNQNARGSLVDACLPPRP